MKQKVQHYDIQRPKLMFIFYIVSLILLSVSFVLMPIGVMALENGKIVTLLAGITFWLGLLGTIITAVLITILKHRERDFVDSQQEHKKMGVICFFQNLPAKIFDILMFVSLVCGIISCFFVWKTLLPFFISLSIFVFSFGMHCMLNGSNYIFINYKKGE